MGLTMARNAPNEFQKLVRGMIQDFAVLVNQPKLEKVKNTKTKKPAYTKSQSQLQQEAKKRRRGAACRQTSRHIPLPVRFKVMRRDGYKCVSCGKSPPKVSLEVVHKKPFSQGGTNDISNLQTLCFKCNRGNFFLCVRVN